LTEEQWLEIGSNDDIPASSSKNSQKGIVRPTDVQVLSHVIKLQEEQKDTFGLHLEHVRIYTSGHVF
jgi:hypothetical protein